ncbi:MAG: putative endonuclease [Cyclobacteriaceae bacterium]|jgi:putative endonuclease
MTNQETGRIGEELSVTFLKEHGYEILEQNFRFGKGELDIIVLYDNRLLVFVEVKARNNTSYGLPETFVTEKQQQLIIQTADNYLHAINWTKDIRFDIISINLETQEIKHLKDAFY